MIMFEMVEIHAYYLFLEGALVNLKVKIRLYYKYIFINLFFLI